MARALAERKRREWEERFKRQRSSGETVARFCAGERVSVNTFYYWSKRLGWSGVVSRGKTAGADSGRARSAVQAGVFRDGERPAEALAEASSLVRFRLGGGVEVEVPAQALDVIRCLAESIERHGAEAARPQRSGGFHELVLGARR
jgi:hypothetical protein